MIVSCKTIITLILLMPFLRISGCRNANTNITNSQSVGEEKYNQLGYNLSNPDKIFLLPGVLHEISGLTEIDNNNVACIQDENGILFIYDLAKSTIRQYYAFHSDGDYEGIARVGKTIFILKSNGTLFEITDYEAGEPAKDSYKTGIPAKDSEGLCYDINNYRLLIAPKSNIEDEKKSTRVIFGFDLAKKRLIAEPVIRFSMQDIRDYVMENKLDLPMTGKDKENQEPKIELRASAIAVHPLTNRLYLISGVERLLYVFNMNGGVEYMEKLDPVLFKQPEGITFLKNGDLLISNEGRGGNGTILRFNLRGN